METNITNQSIIDKLKPIALASLITTLGITLLWLSNQKDLSGQRNYAIGLNNLLAYSSKDFVIEKNAINLALLGKEVTKAKEVDRVVFYDTDNKILGLVGHSAAGPHYTEQIIVDGTLVGYVTVSLNQKAFEKLPIVELILYSSLVIFAVTLLFYLIFKSTKNVRTSIPIVSVPKKKDVPAFCLFINVHNHLSLANAAKEIAIDDALAMASEVCAMYPGAYSKLPEAGILVLLDEETITPYESVKAGWLLQKLLKEIETTNLYRFFLSTCVCSEKPSESSDKLLVESVSKNERALGLRIASLTKADSISLSKSLFGKLNDAQQESCQLLEHPVLNDLAKSQDIYALSPTSPEEETIQEQVNMILGFKSD
mgnify:FL=1